jgi:cysteine-S-conjugate beta-lyase
LLEERLCTLEGGTYCSLVPSGLAAIALVNFSLLKPGDEVLLPTNVYGPSKVLAGGELSHFGISFASYDAMNPQDLEDKISPKTKLVWLEAPGSITMEFPDLPALLKICKAKGILTALDNTWGAGLAFNPFDFDRGQGVDISIHALTKYPSGGGDVLMGSVITRDAALFKLIKLCHMRMGYHVGINDIESVLRSLPSMALRYKAHDVVARQLAAWLSKRAEVVQVLHPALEGAPGHNHWKALCTRENKQDHAAGLFSIMLDAKYSHAQVDAFCDALTCFKLGFSWGGPVSLAVPYDVKALRGGSLPNNLKSGHLVRFSIGLEAVEDLQADLVQAMQVAFN